MTEGKGRGGEIGCDLREGKPSIFFAYVLDGKKGSEAERRRLIEIAAKPREETTRDDVAWAIQFYRSVGAFEFAEKQALELKQRADRVIDEIALNASGKEIFRALSQFMIQRNT
jgi:geranylgeranyl pyrophosphate synthase